MATCLDVFKQAMSIMDELDESGDAVTSDTTEYQNRTVPLLNILCQECYPYSDTYTEQKKAGRRSTAPILSSINDEIDMDDFIAVGVLPYGLVYFLAVDDNPVVANLCLQRYQELLQKLREGIKAESTDIEDVYSGYYDANGKYLGSGNGLGFEWMSDW